MGYLDIALRVLEEEEKKASKESYPSEPLLKSLYLEAFERMGWICGMGRYEPLAKAEDELNRVWQDCLEGKATMEDFKATLSRWVKEARKAYGLCRMKAEELKREGRVIEVRSGGGRVIYIAPSRRTMENLRKDGELWFTVDEVKRFKGLSPQEREKILEVKEIFSGWILRVC